MVAAQVMQEGILDQILYFRLLPQQVVAAVEGSQLVRACREDRGEALLGAALAAVREPQIKALLEALVITLQAQVGLAVVLEGWVKTGKAEATEPTVAQGFHRQLQDHRLEGLAVEVVRPMLRQARLEQEQTAVETDSSNRPPMHKTETQTQAAVEAVVAHQMHTQQAAVAVQA